MTYQRNTEIGADDGAGDDDDDRPLDDLGLGGPLHLLQLGDRLADEAAEAAAGHAARAGLRLRGLRGGPHLLLARAGALDDSLLVGLLLARAALAPSLARITSHYRVSLCVVWRPHQRQYLRSSTRSGVFRLDFELW
jgi:hypothetical protein